MTLVVLAAGMASRYGSLKQIDPVTDSGEFIIDFSIYDAYRAGFDKVVFVIKKEHYEIFRSTIGVRAERYLKVDYAFQDMKDIPSEYISLAEYRKKPWGTAHAVLAARNTVKESFAVINADDFYGKEAYIALAEHLKNAEKSHYCMVGYILKNTLTENGSVSRGVCSVDESNMLLSIDEKSRIYKTTSGAEYEENGIKSALSENTVVSMNCWGFTTDVFELIAKGFEKFLSSTPADNAEYYLPFSINEIKDSGAADVKVYRTNAIWYGVTYKEDKEKVVSGIKRLISKGEYSVPLFEKA